MKLFKNYKKLYENELENRKMLINQNSKLSKERIQAKEEVAKLKLELEDIKGFLSQETEAKEMLKKERTKLKREITMLTKELNKDGE